MMPFFEWLNELPLSTMIRESIWISPVVNVLHLLALVVFAGSVLIVDLRLLGRRATGQPVSQVARDAQPWLIVGFLGLLVTGIPQLISNAMREYFSAFFWFKMEVMLVALIFTFTLRRKVTLADEARIGPFVPKLTGLVSILLWACVAIPARLIGLFT
jgi:ABC-type bacteriocin/lantibiotic exporter with double-glycine peptidase domain